MKSHYKVLDVVLNNLNSKKYNGTIIHIKDGKWTAIIDDKHIHDK